MHRLAIYVAVMGLLLPTRSLAQPEPSTQLDRFDAYLDIRSLDSRGIVDPNWMGDGIRFWYVSGRADSLEVHLVDPEKDQVGPLFDVRRLRRALTAHLGSPLPGRGVPFSMFEFTDGTEDEIRFTLGDRAFRLSLEDYSVATEPPQRTPVDLGEQSAISPNGEETAFIRGFNVWIQHADSDIPRQRTFEGITDQIEWGLGTAPPLWSPDGSVFAVTRWDYRAVAHIPVIDYLADSIQVHWEEAPLPEGPGRSSDLYLISTSSEAIVRVHLDGPSERYVFPLRWSADGKRLFFARWDRGHTQVDLMVTDLSGESRTVMKEVSNTFVIGLNILERIRSGFAPMGNRVLWASERDGWNHLYLYDLEGGLVRQITQGQWPVESILAVDQEQGWVYFSAHGDGERLYDTHIYRVSVEGGEPQMLTEAPGQHLGIFSPTREYFVDIHSNVDRPSTSELRRADGELIRTLAASSESVFEEELGWTPPREFTVKAADGLTDLFGVLYEPADFDPTQRYPVIEFIYAGPEESFVPRNFGERPELHAFSRLGFVVLALDARGTPGRGKAFQDVAYRNFGRYEIEDHAAAFRQLFDRYPFMDSTRVGVFGHSWGGYFAVRALLTAPETYHVGVAFAADGDLDDHRGQEMVIYMGTPEENPDGYAHGENTRFAANLQGKLLLVQGVQDLHVPFSSTLELIDALTRAGRPYDLLLLPRSGHGFSGPVDSRYAREAIKAYFIEHLAGSPNGGG